MISGKGFTGIGWWSLAALCVFAVMMGAMSYTLAFAALAILISDK
jgi:hypothetical protein